MERNFLLTRYRQGKRDFSWADLTQAHLAQAQLPGINLTRANLSGADLSGADLSGANLFKANLSGANLVGADLAGANLRRADLTGARVELAQLHQADTHGMVGVEMPVVERPKAVCGEAEDRDSHRIVARVDEAAIAPSLSPLEPAPVAPPPATPNNHREVLISLLMMGLGYLFYGLALGSQQVPLGLRLLAWLPLGLGLGSEAWVWFVPPLGLVGAVVAIEVSLAVLIFTLPVVLGIAVALAIGGSILGWSWGKTLKTTVWFGSLVLVAMQGATWLFDGSNAYGGGGIVVNFSTAQLALLLGLGWVTVMRGALAYGQMATLGVLKARQGLYIGGAAAAGLLLGPLLRG
ncbi:pentapeptide repeat-containing protein [Nodosilinea sp. LEGE 07088]|uniref:pentapeptide repeat-containing protein n=1 Tax=Nodosilinea sp. LEGE 07088 TaxID=2777968 RepID=UPI0018807B8F|nr:pentapeptide repeat-containing protein [Nodosilinea sp. LEGE 07088]MBE9138992.1 pentapeptide repeat-containing protein [Nodosilinea sp. LEGE 07088]